MRNDRGVVCDKIGRRRLNVLCAALAACVALGSCATARTPKAVTAPAPSAPAATAQAAPLDAKKIIQQRCTVCHGTFRIKVARILPIPADKIVDNMIARGAVLNPAERKAVVEYLAY